MKLEFFCLGWHSPGRGLGGFVHQNWWWMVVVAAGVGTLESPLSPGALKNGSLTTTGSVEIDWIDMYTKEIYEIKTY